MRGQSSEWEEQEMTKGADAENEDGTYTPPKRVTVALMPSLNDPP
jgi:hypothetical protein